MKHLRIKIDKYEVNWELILKNIDFILNESDAIALVWWNWVWKTTIMKIITWEITDFDWKIENIWNMTIWYLAQIYSDDESKLVKEEIKEWFKEIIKTEKILSVLEEKMAKEPENMEIINEYSTVLEQYNTIWWYNYWNIIHNVANGMWILDLLDKRLSEISGWERTKVALCKILVEAPDILCLDEPTNFIDMKSIKWLESYLQNKWWNWYLIISHDREFLDKTCSKTYEVQPQRPLSMYFTNYSGYVFEREKNENIKIAEYKRQQDYIKKEENLINRFRAWSRASFAQSREKALWRLEKVNKPYIPATPKFFFDYVEETNQKILYFKDVFIWREEPLFYIQELALEKKDRIWIIWENWVWKSTLLKTITGQLNVLDWIFTKWKWVQYIYYSQMHEELDKEKTIKENFEKFWIYIPEEQLIWYCKYYLLDRDLIDKKVKYLSGWQTSKVLFAILWRKDSNLLILDEPTNHLDYDSREALEKAISKYPWTVLFISHDRYFVNKIANKMWIIKDQELSISYWNYEDYMYKIENGIDMNMNLLDASLEMDLVLLEKVWEKEAKRLKNKFSRKKR